MKKLIRLAWLHPKEVAWGVVMLVMGWAVYEDLRVKMIPWYYALLACIIGLVLGRFLAYCLQRLMNFLDQQCARLFRVDP